MKPTVGRIVHFFTEISAHQKSGMGKGPYAAVISQVIDPDSCICNLHVFSPTYSTSDMKAVGVKMNDPDSRNWWSWPDRE